MYDVQAAWTQEHGKMWEIRVVATTTFGSLRDDFCKSNQLLAQHCRLYHNDYLVDNEVDVRTVDYEKPSGRIFAHLLLQLTELPVIQVASSVLVNNANNVVHLNLQSQHRIVHLARPGKQCNGKSFVAGLPNKWQTDVLALVTKIRDIHALEIRCCTPPCCCLSLLPGQAASLQKLLTH